jgi:hypothetical protein
MSRGVITLAYGKPAFINMAKWLAKSLQRHDNTLPRAVVTDSADAELLDLFDYVIPYRPEYGSNLRQKMHLDFYSPFEETLFVDSDSLAVRSLNEFWEAFRDYDFGAVGHAVVKRGMWDEYLDTDFILDHFNLTEIPKFNGGIYYLKHNRNGDAVCNTARKLLRDWERLKFKTFRGDGPCDEALYGVAMAMHGIKLNNMKEKGMYSPLKVIGSVKCDVLGGHCRFNKEGRIVTPSILHFATWTERYLYRRECLRIDLGRDLSFSESLPLRVKAAGSWIIQKRKGAVRKMNKLLSKSPKETYPVNAEVHS